MDETLSPTIREEFNIFDEYRGDFTQFCRIVMIFNILYGSL
jgi:hypothetical protein